MLIIIDHYGFFAVSCLNFSRTSSLCDYKVLRPPAQYFSLCSCMSTEWLISSGRDKRLVSMATTYAHINMPAVCADKAWRYVFLSLGLSTPVVNPGVCTNTGNVPGLNLEGKLLVGHL